MAQPWHGGRGGPRGKGGSLRSSGGPNRQDMRTNVWSSAGRAAAAPLPALPPSEVGSTAPTPFQSASAALSARTSIRKAADVIEAAAEQSAAEIEASLKEVEDRLTVVIAQEEEVRVVADEHLEREAFLTKLLEDLYRKQKEEQGGKSPLPGPSVALLSPSPSAEAVEAAGAGDAGPRTEVASATPGAPGAATAKGVGGEGTAVEAAAGKATAGAAATNSSPAAIEDAVSADLAVQKGVSQTPREGDVASSPRQPETNAATTAVVASKPTNARSPRPAQAGSGSVGQARRRQRANGHPRSGQGSSAAAASAAAGGKDPSPSLLLAMAMGKGVVPGGDEFLTNDADTIAEYIGLMAHDAEGEEIRAAPVEGGDTERPVAPGLSLTEALDRAETIAAHPVRMPHLLALAMAVRPFNGVAALSASDSATATATAASGRTTEAVNPSSFRGAKRKASDDERGATEAADGHARTAGAPRVKRKRVDANAIMCPFELNGVCNDDDCRYQHLDAFLPPAAASTTSTAASQPPNAPAKGSPGTDLNTTTVAAAAAAATPREAALASKQYPQLPAIDFRGEREGQQRRAARDGDRGNRRSVGDAKAAGSSSGKGVTVTATSTDEPTGGDETGSASARASASASASGNGSHGREERKAAEEGGESGEETTSVDGEEDFLALPVEGVPHKIDRGSDFGSGGGSAADDEGEASLKAAAATAVVEDMHPAELAEAFAQAASGASMSRGRGNTGGISGGGGGGAGKGAAGGGAKKEERYYLEDGSGRNQGAAVAALTQDQLSALEAQLNESASCDVGGWLLLALHRLPRTGDSALAVLNNVANIARGANGPMESGHQAAIKAALRTFVQPLERAEGEQAEALWLLYLRLYASLPGKGEDALGMAEFALEKFPVSRRIWRLYHSMLKKSTQWSLSGEMSCYRRQLEALLLLQSRAADSADAAGARASSSQGTSSSSSSSSGRRNSGENGPGRVDSGGGAGAGDDVGVGSGSGGGGGRGGGDRCRKEAILEMIVYLVLERCSLLSESGYKLQATAETLDALGALTEGQPLWGWDDAGEEGARTVLRTPSQVDSCTSGGGGAVEGAETEGTEAPKDASDGGHAQGLPKGVAAALKDAPRESRSLLWLTALHLLMIGVFPRHALLLAEIGGSGGGGSLDGGTQDNNNIGDLANFLFWPKERLSPKNKAGLKVPVSSPVLEDTLLKTFMNALHDVGLLPPKSQGVRGWAPATKARDAVLPSAAEAKAARAGGKAPEPSTLEGPPLALALNWLAFCRGRADAKQGRAMAIACCRRFQLARPDHPALLEYCLLEHPVSKARTLDDIYEEISRAFDPEGVAAEALREREDEENLAVPPLPTPRAATNTNSGGAKGSSSGSGSGSGSSGGIEISASSSSPSQSSSSPPLPSGARLHAVYAFLRFLEMRLQEVTARSNESSSTTTERDTVEATRRVLHKALVCLWAGAGPGASQSGTGVSPRSEPDLWLRREGGGGGDEHLDRALEGAKASLFRWADGGSDTEAEGCAGTAEEVGSRRSVGRRLRGHRRRRRCADVPGRNGERQLSTMFFSLWVLGGAPTAIGTLDHLLSAESFSSMSAERRRLAWMQRLEAAVIVSAWQAQMRVKDSLQGVREVVLRALADPRTHRSAEYTTLAHFVAATVDRPVAGGSINDSNDKAGPAPPFSALELEASVSSSFAFDVLTVYANHFREIRGGVDWLVAAEALGIGGTGGGGGGGGGVYDGRSSARTACAAIAVLRWVSRADHNEGEAVAKAAAESSGVATGDGASALKSNARPYVEKALARNPGNPCLSGAVAALGAATACPGRAQRFLEAALRAHPHCAALWEQRIALEAAFGRGSTERAGATASAAAASGTLIRLSCGKKLGEGHPGAQQARAAGRILATISDKSIRRETRSFSLQAVLSATGDAGEGGGGSGAPRTEVPRSVFLMTNLVSLSLAFNGLLSIPAAIGRLVLLRSLDVSGNMLTALPLSLSRLSGSLRVLRAAGNRLGSPLPVAPLGDLVGLNVLDLEYNELSRFPEAVVRRLKELRTLKLVGNAFGGRAPVGWSDALPHLEELTLPTAVT